MGANTANAMLFLVTTLFDLALWIYLLRVLLQWSRADFYNPISQAIWKATRYPGDWLRPHLPNWRNLNIAAVLMLVALAVIYIYVVTGMHGFSIGLASALWFASLKLVDARKSVVLGTSVSVRVIHGVCSNKKK